MCIRDMYTYSELTVLAKWTPLVKITYRIDSSEYAFEDESKSVISVVSGKPLGAEAFPKLTAKVDNPKTRFKGWYDENGKQINPDNFVSKDKTEVVYTAQWHPPLYVSIYNNDLKRDSKYYNGHFYIHFIPPYVADNSNGNYGGGSECIIMPVKNGKPDTTKRCALNAVYYDLAGKYYYMDIRQNRYLYYYDQNGKQQSVSFYGVDFCVEYIHTDGTARTYLVSASDLNVEVHNHIFIRDGSDEYTKAW